MAASPSQQTHWLKLRVDLGLERHSGMDPKLGAGLGELSQPSLLLLCDAVVTACIHTGKQEGEGWRRTMHFSLWAIDDCGQW